MRNDTKRPIIVRSNNGMMAGFIGNDGSFERDMFIRNERDIDTFMDKYELSIVCIGNM